MHLDFLGWNPWALYGGVGARGWNPWGFALAGTPTAAAARTLALGQQKVLPQVQRVQTPYAPPTNLDDPDAYWGWTFDVRMSLLVSEFLSRVRVEIDQTSRSASVSGVVDTALRTLVTINAPTAHDINIGTDGLQSTQDKHPADSASIDALVAQDEGIDTFMLRCVGALPEKNGAKYELARAFSILVNLVCLRLKHAFAVKRPSELDSGIVPMLPVPGHGSFPGGHATMASALALVVAAVSKGTIYAALNELAREIALNRVRAGLHYQLDSTAGHELGEKLGAYLLATLAADEKKSCSDKLLPMLGVVWAKANT